MLLCRFAGAPPDVFPPGPFPFPQCPPAAANSDSDLFLRCCRPFPVLRAPRFRGISGPFESIALSRHICVHVLLLGLVATQPRER
eukprot:13661069-Alexandrium_andersonii.AAC.1